MDKKKHKKKKIRSVIIALVALMPSWFTGGCKNEPEGGSDSTVVVVDD